MPDYGTEGAGLHAAADRQGDQGDRPISKHHQPGAEAQPGN